LHRTLAVTADARLAPVNPGVRSYIYNIGSFMLSSKRDNSLGKGIYFRPEEYIGITRRFLITFVDAVILFVASNIILIIANAIGNKATNIGVYFAILNAWAYLTILKPSPARTIGYALFGVKIVTLRGDRPSVIRMTFRMLMWILGPFNMIIDLLWVGLDDDNQTLRDRYSGTMVIKNDAIPLGEGEIHMAKFYALGFTLFYPRVFPKQPINNKTDEPKAVTT